MEVLLTHDVLRAARTLMGLSQRALEMKAEIARSSIVAAESNIAPGSSTVLKLRSFYEKNGLEFVGTLNVGTGKTIGLGVRWLMPSQIPPREMTSSEHTERSGLAFAAARSMLNMKQADVASFVKISDHKIRLLEGNLGADEISRKCLRRFYEDRGIEFLGWGDVSRDVYYGVGVRWKVPPGETA